MKKGKIAVLCTLTLFFMLFAYLGFSGLIKDFELSIHTLINPNKESNAFFKFFTDIGEAAGVIGVTAFLMLLPVTRRRVGAPLSVTVTSSWLICTAIKYTVQKPRPVERIIEIGGYSFPSGHAMNNAALYIGIMILMLKICKNKVQKTIVIFICSLLPLLIGISRIYFNVHYLSDVICGWCLGSIFAIIFTEIYFRNEWKFFKKDKK